MAETRTQVQVDRECDVCGKEATKKHSFLLPNARGNPASSGYGGDDISWCSDYEMFSCDDCSDACRYGKHKPDGYKWCSTFPKARFAHMFKQWETVEEADDNG